METEDPRHPSSRLPGRNSSVSQREFQRQAACALLACLCGQGGPSRQYLGQHREDPPRPEVPGV